MSRSYEVDLWADDLKIVIERYKEGKKLLKDTIDILKERTNAEEMFYKTLQKVIKTPSINQPNGTIVNCWLSIRAHQDALQKQHSIVYSQLNEIVNKLVSLKNEQTKTKKNLENEANKLIKEFKTSKLNLSKAKAKFHNISKETESLNLNYNTQQNSLPPKELTKLKNKIQNLQKQTETADTQYKNLVKSHHDVQKNYIDSMKQILSNFQQLDMKRSKTLQEIMQNYLQFEEQFNSELKDAIVNVKNKVQDLNPENDLQVFLAEKHTGLQPPPFEEYESPNSQSGESTKPNLSTTGVSSTSNSDNFPLGNNNVASTNSVSNTNTSSTTNNQYTNLNQTEQVTKSIDNEPKKQAGTVDDTTYQNDELNLKAKALYDYTADEENELGFKEGNIITILKKHEGGWWEGECNGKIGIFPGNYVEIIERKCVATYSYKATSEDELTINEGDIITILSEAEGWMLGVNKEGKQGLFPANHIKELSTNEK